MQTAINYRSLARLEFPDAKIEGTGAYALIPCFPRAKAYLFRTLAEAQHAQTNGWMCAPFCGGTHKGLILRAPKTADNYRSPSYRDKD
jgi:hypothetical protein